MNRKIIKQASIVNEGKIMIADVLIVGERIEKIANHISDEHTEIINAAHLFLLPGVIDDQVHFREPGLTHKATIYSESRAAVAGGITSFMDMPNTIPNTLTIDLLEEKYAIASKTSYPSPTCAIVEAVDLLYYHHQLLKNRLHERQMSEINN